ncbi:MAG: type II 3-dehydroquinate dehydratase [Flavobacteriaceae bacterium]|jgi:3-dehydroquinate dehydratase-2|nr:type II 3-dehydroquinate dehydratase [Flavobacteriaceae bacterium]|tara:strand:+ start:37177 stop:37602 length:426 start_codon:yes stop_codon:yes gene_type:complete
MKNIIIINGPNLNLLGKREPNIYGNVSFDEFLKKLRKLYSNIIIDYYQSNIEGEIIDKLQEVGFSYSGIVLNAAAYTHTSVGIADAISAIDSPVIEVHISNIHKREEIRHKSLISKSVYGIICGFGLKSYEMAVHTFITNE